jgi:hypothetical protein
LQFDAGLYEGEGEITMKKIFITTLLSITFITGFGQTKYFNRKVLERLTDSIQTEGKTLYRSEWASWYGTDIFTEKCADKRNRIGGYISYETKNGLNNVFFTKGESPTVLSTISFSNDLNPKKYTLDTTARGLSVVEKEYYDIRTAVIKRMTTDTVFKYYKDCSLNPVPIINKGTKRVYLLTAPNVNGVVLFGNDYQVNFNKKNEISTIVKLHNSLIAVKSGKEKDSTKTVLSSYHSHVEGKDPFMTATDICTMMLYHQFTTWNTFAVISKDYVSNWDCNKNELVILTMEAWKKIDGLKRTLGGNQ